MKIDDFPHDPYVDMSGIYCFQSIFDSRCYIGSASYLHKRIWSHFSSLRLGKHKNKKLQNFVNKYGINSLEIKILKLCDIPDLESTETYLIKAYNAYSKGFNMAPTGKNNRGIKFSEEFKKGCRERMTGTKRTDESRLKQSLSTRKYYSENESSMKGKKLSEETKTKMGNSRRGSKNSTSKINEEIAKQIKTLLLTNTVKDTSSMLNVGFYIVADIKRNKTWKHVNI